MNHDTKVNIDTLADVIRLQLKLDAKIQELAAPYEAQIAELQNDLNGLVKNLRAQLNGAVDYEVTLREKISTALKADYFDRLAALGRGEKRAPMALPPWLVMRKTVKVEVQDPTLVPEQFWSKEVDEKAIREAEDEIPGTTRELVVTIQVTKGKMTP